MVVRKKVTVEQIRSVTQLQSYRVPFSSRVLGYLSHFFGNYSFLSFAPKRLEEVLDTLVSSPFGLVVGARSGDHLVGLFAAEMVIDEWAASPNFLNGLVLKDVYFSVHPAFRKGLTAYKLLSKASAIAKELGCEATRLSVTSGFDNERISRFYTGIGYAEEARIYSKLL